MRDRSVLVRVIVVLAALGGAACRTGDAPAGLEEGRRLYLAHGCRVCHGEFGEGDGPVGLTLDPRPTDFRSRSAFKQGASVDEIARSIAQGVRQPKSMMQAYAHIPEADRLLLAEYIQSLIGTMR